MPLNDKFPISREDIEEISSKTDKIIKFYKSEVPFLRSYIKAIYKDDDIINSFISFAYSEDLSMMSLSLNTSKLSSFLSNNKDIDFKRDFIKMNNNISLDLNFSPLRNNNYITLIIFDFAKSIIDINSKACEYIRVILENSSSNNKVNLEGYKKKLEYNKELFKDYYVGKRFTLFKKHKMDKITLKANNYNNMINYTNNIIHCIEALDNFLKLGLNIRYCSEICNRFNSKFSNKTEFRITENYYNDLNNVLFINAEM